MGDYRTHVKRPFACLSFSRGKCNAVVSLCMAGTGQGCILPWFVHDTCNCEDTKNYYTCSGYNNLIIYSQKSVQIVDFYLS